MHKKYIPVLVILGLLIVGAVVYSTVIKPTLDNKTISVVANEVIDRSDLAFKFTFPSGDAGYSLIEQPGIAPTTTASSTAESSPLRQMFLIMDTPAYTMYQAEGWKGTMPPTISIFVFDISDDTSTSSRMDTLKNWAKNNAALSAYNQVVGEPGVVDLDGVDALQYTIPGDYNTTFTLASYKGNVYLLAGQYKDESDDIKATYSAVVESVEFY